MKKENSQPSVSVVMPAYNAEKYIEESITSVINQTYTNWELIVIDDGSKDNTAEIVKQFAEKDKRITLYLNEKNMGVAKTRNRGFDMAKGEYIALLDSDDIWLPEKLEKQLKLAEETDAEIIYCSYELISETGEKTGKDFIVSPCTDFCEMLTKCMFSCSTNIFKSEIFKNYRFSNNYYHEDYVLWLELLKNGKIAAGCTEVLAKYRQIKGSRASNKLNAAKNRWIIYRKYLKLPLVKTCIFIAKYAYYGAIKYKK